MRCDYIASRAHRRPAASYGVGVYVPHFNALDDVDAIDAMVRSAGAGDLVTADADGVPYATRLPLVWLRGESRVIAHMAIGNPHWRKIAEDAPALLVVSGPQAYVSPSWYASKMEHGRVVPTWNYSRVELRGTVRVRREPEWLREAVTILTDLHERSRTQPWAVTDAPAPFVDGQLRGIVGIEVRVTSVEGKAKLSQNRSQADRTGVVRGLRGDVGAEVEAIADAMEAHSSATPAPDTGSNT